jgi:hypothetical protein
VTFLRGDKLENLRFEKKYNSEGEVDCFTIGFLRIPCLASLTLDSAGGMTFLRFAESERFIRKWGGRILFRGFTHPGYAFFRPIGSGKMDGMDDIDGMDRMDIRSSKVKVLSRNHLSRPFRAWFCGVDFNPGLCPGLSNFALSGF